MSDFLLARIATVLRDYAIVGVASSGEHEPIKSELRGLLAQFVAEIANEESALSPEFQAEVADLVNRLETLEAIEVVVVANAVAAAASELAAAADAAQAAVSRAAADLAAEQAIAAAEATGAFVAFDTKALADAGAAFLPDGTRFRVWQDETQSDHQTIYVKESGVLVFKADLDLPAARLGVFDTRALAAAQFIPSATDSVKVSGYAVVGDLGEAVYKRVAVEPAHAGKFQSADGSWWELDSRKVRPEMFGVFTNPTVTTATMLAGNTFATIKKRPIIYSAEYVVNGHVTDYVNHLGRELHIETENNPKITVDPTAVAFPVLFFMESNVRVNHSIRGGSPLVIDCNNKCGSGIWLRHMEAANGGSVVFESEVRVYNLLMPVAGAISASGITAIGRYDYIKMNRPVVEEVARSQSAGECAGISLSGFAGRVELHSPETSYIYSGGETSPGVPWTDADGIKCFGHQIGTTNNRRLGSVRIYGAVFRNCQGRSYKDQCGDSIIMNPVVERRANASDSADTASPQAVEFDFQFGGGRVENARLEYYKDGATSPITAASHTIFAFQQMCDNASMHGAAINTTVLTEVEITRVALHNCMAGTQDNVTQISGLEIIGINGFAASTIDRAILECEPLKIEAAAGTSHMIVTDCHGAMDVGPIGYTGFTTGDLTAKWSWEIDRCSTSLLVAGNQTRGIFNLSGNQVTAFRSFMLGDNPGYRSLYQNWSVCLKRMRAGTKIALNLGGSGAFVDTDLVTPVAVPWGVSGIIVLMAHGLSNFGNSQNDSILTAYLDSSTVSPSAWFTQYGGVTWMALN